MADKAASDLTEGTVLAAGDLHIVTDVSDTTADAAGTTKRYAQSVLSAMTETLTNKTINTASNTITVVEANISDLQTYLRAADMDTLAELNAIIGDATLDTSSATRTPAAHNQAASTINSGTLDAARLPAASTSAVGGMETATAAEVNTGTDAGRAVSPDSLAGSAYGTAVVTVLISDPNGDAITTGDGKAYWRVPSTLAGFNLVAVAAQVTTVSSSGLPTVQIHNLTDTADMLSTALTIDASELDSSTAATAAVINTATDDVTTGDQIRFDIDVAGTGTKGLMVEMQFRLP